MNSIEIEVDLEREVILASLPKDHVRRLEVVLQWLIGHHSEPWIDDTMLNASREDLRSINAVLRCAARPCQDSVVELNFAQSRNLIFALMYAKNQLVDEPRVAASVQNCIVEIADDLVAHFTVAEDKIRRHANSRRHGSGRKAPQSF